MKKILMLFAMFVCLLVFSSVAVSAEAEGAYTYEVSGRYAIITEFDETKADGTDVVVPDALGGYTVREIAQDAFYGCSSITSITLGDNLRTVGRQAFAYCDNLESVYLGKNTSILSRAFEQCDNLKSIAVSPNNGVYTSVDGNLFSKDMTVLVKYAVGKDETEYIIPEGVKVIDDYAFSGDKGLVKVDIPEGVERISIYAFSGCTALNDFTIPESLKEIGTSTFMSTARYNDKKNWIDGVLYLDGCLLAADESLVGTLNVQPGTRVIASDVFAYCDEITKIVLPDGLKSISDMAFYDCENLAEINLPDSVVYIGAGILKSTDFFRNDVNWLDDIMYVDNCIIVADSILTVADIKPGTRVIAESAFASCSDLEELVIPYGVTHIGQSAFDNTAISYVAIPDSVVYLGSGAFSLCENLESVSIGKGLKTIETDMFSDCIMLSEIIIPESIEMIGEYAFSCCDELVNVYYRGTEEQWDEIEIMDDNDGLEYAEIIMECIPTVEPTLEMGGGDDEFVITAETQYVPRNASVFAVGYDGSGRVLWISSYEIMNDNTAEIAFEKGDAKKVKVFVWSDNGVAPMIEEIYYSF